MINRLYAVLIFTAATSPLLAQSSCEAPTLVQREAVTNFTVAKYHLQSVDDLTLVTNSKTNEACFWEFDYLLPKGKTLALFLSPDRNFVSPSLFDLRDDPRAEELKREQATAKALLNGDPASFGPSDAPVTLVEFSDFECPFCLHLAEVLEKDVLPAEGNKVRIIFRNFPLPMHPWARDGALIAECAALQSNDAFWKVHDYLFENQKALSATNLDSRLASLVATTKSLDPKQFQTCVDKQFAVGLVERDIALGQQNGVYATPTFFVNGVMYEGVKDAAQLRNIIDQAALTSRPVTSQAGITVKTAVAGKEMQ